MRTGFFNRRMVFTSIVAAVVVATASDGAEPVGTAFTHQGQIKQNGAPINGSVALEFTVWNDTISAVLQSQLGPTLTFDGQGGNAPPRHRQRVSSRIQAGIISKPWISLRGKGQLELTRKADQRET